jgi:hypothetical protein
MRRRSLLIYGTPLSILLDRPAAMPNRRRTTLGNPPLRVLSRNLPLANHKSRVKIHSTPACVNLSFEACRVAGAEAESRSELPCVES